MQPLSKLWPFSPLAVVVLAAAPVQAQDAPEAPTPGTTTPPPAPVATPQVLAEPEVSVDELVQRALANNPQLPISRQTLEAARQRLGAVRAFRNPVLQLVPRIVGSSQAAETEVILSQPLDVFGQRRAQRGVASAEVRRAEADTTLAERRLVVQVKNSAADLFAAQEAESLGSVQVEVAQLFRDAAARRAELGDVPPVQAQRAELELLRVQNDLTNAQTERLARRAALNQLVGQAPETPLRVALPTVSGLTDLLRVRPGPLRSGAAGGVIPSTGATGTTGVEGVGAGAAGVGIVGAGPGTAGIGGGAAEGSIPSVPSAEGTEGALAAPGVATPGGTLGGGTLGGGTIIGGAGAGLGGGPLLGASAQVGSNLVGLRGQILPSALTGRPDVVGAQATLEARQAEVQVLRRSRLPNIELQARRGSFFGQGSNSYALRAVVTLPIFDFGSIKRERRALEAEVGAQQATIDLLRSQIATQVEQALLRLQQQQQTVARYRTGIVPQTLDLLRKTQIGYAQGASTYLEVLEAQRTLRQVQTEYLQALVGTRTQEAALEGALGSAPTADLLGSLSNPSGPAAPPGTAAPGTVPPGTIPAIPQEPLSPSSSTVPSTPTIPTAPGTQDGGAGG